MRISIEELSAFLREANRHTYAADSGKVASSLPGSKDLEYQVGNLKYHDTYFGSRRFIGMEIVYEDGILIWGMNYYGYIMAPDVDSEEVYTFLKEALMQDSDPSLPVRGPTHYRRNPWCYLSGVLRGDIISFRLFEVIFKRDNKKFLEPTGRRVYECECFGGLL